MHAVVGRRSTLGLFIILISMAGCGEVMMTASAVALAQPYLAGQLAPAQQKDAVKVKGLYLTGWTVGSMDRVEHFVQVANDTEINSYVIDIKDDDGLVGYESQLPEVREIGAWKKKYNPRKVLPAFHEHGIHVIGRVVCFKDPILSSKKPELAVKTAGGSLWRDDKNLTWLNPYNRASWPYLVAIAKEGVELGFDEIQFDYVRFASDGDKKAMRFGDLGKTPKYNVINDFLAYVRKEMPNVVLSADVFGIICESPSDTEDIGQCLELVGRDVDYISPMVYPSHYAQGQVINKVKFTKPDLKPYDVVYHTLTKAKQRISGAQNYRAGVRPYLQDFTATWLGAGSYQKYGPEQVRQQIKAVYEAGYEEWILWSASNKYSESALGPDKQVTAAKEPPATLKPQPGQIVPASDTEEKPESENVG